MKTELQEQCTICYEILNSVEQITITKEILEDLRSLVQTIDFTLLQHKPICKACSAKIKLACKFKTTYLDFQGHFIKVNNVKDVYSDKPVYCEICKNIVNSSDTIPMFDPLSQVNKSTIINHLCAELNSRINEDPQTCESCHKSMLNFCNITNLLSVFDQDLICDENESESVTVKKELQQSDIVSTSANSSEHHSVKVKDEVIPIVQNMKVEKNSIKYDEFIAKNEQLDLKMDCEEELGDDGLKALSKKAEKNVSDYKSFLIRKKKSSKTKPTTKKIVNRHFKCYICKFTTKSKSDLNTHILVHMNDNDEFQCGSCEYKTKVKYRLQRHVRIHMQPDETEMLECGLCEFKTRENSYLKKHMRVHTKFDESKMFYCNLCNLKTNRKDSLKRHMMFHTTETLQCEMCEYKTKNKYTLKRHMVFHANSDEMDMLKCKLCEYETKFKRNFNHHILVHKEPNEITMFKCDVCGSIVKDKFSYKRHMQIHKDPNEVKMYQCELCLMKTRHKFNLKKHMELHSTTERFQCEICEFKSKFKSSLKTHMILIHQKKN